MKQLFGKKHQAKSTRIATLSLCCVIGREVKKQSRRIIRDPLNIHVGKEKKKQTERSWKEALVGAGRIKSVNSTSKKNSLYLQVFVHYISDRELVQRPTIAPGLSCSAL